MEATRTKFWKSHSEAIFWIVFLLLGIGCINVFNASQVAAENMFSNSKHYLYRYGFFALLGFFVMYVCSRIDYHIWLKKVDFLVVLTALLLGYVLFKSDAVKGAQRWIQIASFISFQPSELAKMVVVILSAAALGRRVDRGKKANLFTWPVFLTCFFGLLVYMQPDLGTAAIIVALVLGIYFMVGLPAQQYAMLLLSVPVAIVYLATRASYRAQRVEAWLDPWAYANETGYQTVQSIMAIGSGGFSGAGIGRGSSKFYYLPEAHTDFSFAVLCQEAGFIGGVLVIGIFIYLFYTLWNAAEKAPDGAGYILLMGTNFLITGQAVANIAMVMGLLPVIGLPLPFISYGGTSLLINMIMLGIAINVLRQSDRCNEPLVVQEEKRKLYLVKG